MFVIACAMGGEVVFAANPTQDENTLAGTTDWKLTNPGGTSGVIEGYASLTSVNKGGQILLYVNTAEPTYTMDIFRLGDYQGLGGRRMMPTINRTGTAQPTCPMDSFGMVECSWGDPYALNVPADWVSGIYVVKLTAGSSGTQQYIEFVVRDDQRNSDLLLVQCVSTYQAYNTWGGKSLYGTTSSPADTANKAMKVSFDRPYYGDDNNGVGNLFNASYYGWELGMLQWLEREGRDVTYATSVDLDANSALPLNHKAVLSVGHDEYWSWNMRQNFVVARDAGVSWGFFSGNVSYWQVRFEPGVTNPTPGRVMVGYKEFWYNDPIQPDYLKTNEFRYAPVNWPEDQMAGVMFVTQAKPAFCVEDASHWALTGTNLKNGDCLTNPDGSTFLGYEIDSMIGPGSPANVQRLAHSPVFTVNSNGYAEATDYSDAVSYRAASGATVFATGSIGWSQSIPEIQQLTRNVLDRFIYNAYPETIPARPNLPGLFQAADIGDTGRPGFVTMATDTSFTVNGAGQGTYNSSDSLYYVYQPLSGDGQIVARVGSLRLYWDNRAGVMIRESLDPTSNYVSLQARPSGSTGSLLEGVEFLARTSAGNSPSLVAQQDQLMPNWLKLVRSGDLFSSFVSVDGVNWTVLGSVSLSIATNVYIGLNVTSSQRAVWATANFDNVAVTSSGGGDGGGTTTGTALDRSDWTVSATESSPSDFPSNAIDGNPATRWSSGEAQHDSQGFFVSWPTDRLIRRIRMEVGDSVNDWPRQCAIWVKDSSYNVTFAGYCNTDSNGTVDMTLPSPTLVNRIEIWQWGVTTWWWSISELNVFQ